MSTPNDNSPLARLRHHVTGAIKRGEATPIVGQPSPAAVELALAEEKANQDKVKATVEQARASATQPQGASFLPWYHERGCDQYYNEWVVKDCDGRSLVSLWRDSDEDNQANAAFIALACNSYAGLMQERDALQAQRDELLSACKQALIHLGHTTKTFDQVHDAIARATEGGASDNES